MSEHVNKLDPSTQEWINLLDALRREAREGRLLSLTFMLQEGPNPDNAIVDSYGKPPLTEAACRRTVEAIAQGAEAVSTELAKAIRDNMPKAKAAL